MNIKSLIVGFALLFPLIGTAQNTIKPTIKKYTSTFAIVIDEETWKQTEKDVRAYQQSLEKKGLGTYIIHHNWTSPELIRTTLEGLYNQPIRLEGAVLVGNIPVPMIRDAQHLTSAFKMDQRINWTKSSVPSDRYYDDFHLKFNFIKQDSLKKDYFYYSLDKNSPQIVQMSIYTARIKPPVIEGVDANQQIRDFFKKAVAEHERVNKLDHMISYTSYGYHSESLVTWADEQITLKEQMPSLFKPGARTRFMNFRMGPVMKYQILSEMQREDLDFFIYNGHGSDDSQLINGYHASSGVNPSIENVKRYLRSKVQSSSRKKEDVQARMEGFHKSLDVPLSWMKDAISPETLLSDSLLDANSDLVPSDLAKYPSSARFVFLNACDNGSFNMPDYIAGHYPFGKGKTVLSHANSIGVLQDIWPNELLGLLNHGIRAGNLLKLTADLETHLFGDPTLAFQDEYKVADLNHLIVYPEKNKKTWNQLAKSTHSDLATLALKEIYYLDGYKTSNSLKEAYLNSNFASVRLQAFQLLSRIDDANYKEVLKAALNDPYELTRRLAVTKVGEYGGDDFIPTLVDVAINDQLSERVDSRIRHVITLFDNDKVIAELSKQLKQDTYLVNPKELSDRLIPMLNNQKSKLEKTYVSMKTTVPEQKAFLADVKTLRLYNYHQIVPVIIELIASNKIDEVSKVVGVEVLGWFNKSFQKAHIIALCDQLIANKNESKSVKDEAMKTKSRML